MRKKINVDELELGMYLEEICGSWIDNPFWRSRFVLSDPKEIAMLRASKVSEVWIDVSKGADVWPTTAVAELGVLENDAPDDARRSMAMSSDRTPTPIADEIDRAARICAAGKEAVTSMFHEARMGNAVNASGVVTLVQEISDSVARNPSALISLARLKTADDYTYMHSVAVCAMMIALARQLNQSEDVARSAGVAGLLHDVGKMLVPSEVLNKPGKLSDSEFTIVKGHPVKGHQFLQESTGIDPIALDVCLHHHEKVDGSGYPKGLKGPEISLFAKMGAVCDVYDAITSNRPYKAGWDPSESLRQMGQWASGHFDLTVFQAFAKTLGIYPVGSLVRLNSGCIGVVIEQSKGALTMPVVKVFYRMASSQRIDPVVMDLSARGCKEKIIAREDPAKWKFADLDAMWSGLVA
ncbi:HD-GYP domain-containing protein [Roseateles sp.]|uniref:HD-GYP domain-containing protein n=1 Tax=Roseateles sp. TaxID=1971397 RepID=UPI00286C0781|nr:HD-GYP domain-containing protein [Roseateles sp.]